MSGDHCEGCRFWDRYEGSLSTSVGDCRFNPPAISDVILKAMLPGPRCDPLDEQELSLYPASAFPITHAESWCGRFERPHHGVIPC